MSRDWKNDPPKTLEDGFELARLLAEGACASVARKYKDRPFARKTDKGYEIVWEDGEVTNAIDVEYVH